MAPSGQAAAAWETFTGSSAYGSNNATSSGTAVLQLTTAPPQLFCSATGSTWTIYSTSEFVSTVTFTRVDGITNGTPTSPARRRRRAGPRPGVGPGLRL